MADGTDSIAVQVREEILPYFCSANYKLSLSVTCPFG
jgi:hypothetical protein